MDKLKIAFGYILICLIWGSTWIGIKFSVEAFPPFFAASGRFIIAAFSIWVIIRLSGIPLPLDKKSFRIYLMLGLFSYAIPFSLVYWAETVISSGLGAILFATFPFFVVLFSVIEFKEKIEIPKIIGVILGFVGIVMIFADDLTAGNNTFWGILAILTSAIIQAYMTIYIKRKAGYLNPIAMSFVPLILSGIFVFILGFLFEDISSDNFTTKGILAVVYMGIFGTVIAFSTYYWLMQKIDVVILAISTFITPIIALYLGWFILQETFSNIVYFASALVLLGVLLANFKELKNYILRKK